MTPDLEVVQIRQGESFKAWSHGYPYHTVRWHFHPEYEIHLVVETSGRYFVGDFIGVFQPGNLVLTGPNLPHNWVSDVPKDTSIPLRGRIIQFGEHFVSEATRLLPELSALQHLLDQARRGLLFPASTGERARPLMEEIVHATGLRRLELFLRITDLLCSAHATPLASSGYIPDPSGYMSTGMNQALNYLRQHLTDDFTEEDLARIAGQPASSFSRAFRRHTGMTLVQYVRRLRINLACQLLMSDEQLPVADICFVVGYNNLSNFNRQFLGEKGMPPSQFRRLMMENVEAANAA